MARRRHAKTLIPAREAEVAHLIRQVVSLISETLGQENVSQGELARRLGVTQPNVSALLKGEANTTLRRVAESLYHLGFRLTVGIERIGRQEEAA